MQNLLPLIDSADKTFHDGDPLTGELGTIVTALFLNNVQSAIRNAQEEILAIMTDAGITADDDKTNQLLDALKTTFALKNSPGLTGNPTATTQAKTDNSTKIATTAHVKSVVADYAPLANPALTGTPTAPTAGQTVNNTQIATTAFVKAAIAALVDSSPGALDTLNELAAALGDDPNFAATMNAALAGKAALASPALTGTPTAPTAAASTSNTQIATTAFVTAVAALKASLASPAFTGTPTAPTAAAGTNNTQIATTAFVAALAASKAELASPAFTGTPTAPTAAQTANDTQLATTAFVKAALSALVASSPAALDTLNELAAAINNDPNFAATMTNALAAKAPLASPALTGTPTAPTAAATVNNTQIATTAHVKAAIAAGTAAGAGKLSTARKINGVAFDGTADINLNLGLTLKAFGQYSPMNGVVIEFTAVDANTLRCYITRQDQGYYVELGVTKMILVEPTLTDVISGSYVRRRLAGTCPVTKITMDSGLNASNGTWEINYPSHGVVVGAKKSFYVMGLVYREVGMKAIGQIADIDGLQWQLNVALDTPVSSPRSPIMAYAESELAGYFGLPIQVYGRKNFANQRFGALAHADLLDNSHISICVSDNNTDNPGLSAMITVMVYDL